VIMNMCSKKEVSVPATLPDGRPRYSGCRWLNRVITRMGIGTNDL
jgi:hypothetical protein